MPFQKSTYIPEPPNKFNKKQVILSSDRVLLNARTDSVMLFAKKAISFSSANTINLDCDKECIINSPQIYLGLNAKEPLLLGDKTVELLNELLNSLNELAISLGSAKANVGDVEYPLTDINTPAQALQLTIESVLVKLADIKSKQNFTL